MAVYTFEFYGKAVEHPIELDAEVKTIEPGIQVKTYTALAVRSSASQAETLVVKDNEVISLTMSNGVEWFYDGAGFEAFLKKQSTARGSGNMLVVPSELIPLGGTRGWTETISTVGIKIFTGMAAEGTAQWLVTKMESKLQPGLYGLNDAFKFTSFDKEKAATGKPYLLFIHGTNSTTEGAFQDLKTNEVYANLFKYYEGRVLAFEHKTLSESPVKNVIQLLEALPSGITTDIVCHSRGGLIADLLARCSEGELPFNSDELGIINTNADFTTLREEAEAANAAAKGKNLTIQTMVRVATPSAGTLVIDERLDNFANLISNLVKYIPEAAVSMSLGLLVDFARAVAKERTNINVFPGVAAQIPGSPLIRLLNNPNREIKSRLFVISGDVEHEGFWKSLLVMSTNLYFGEAHDLVVNSNSMLKGTYRSSDVFEHFAQDSSVNHFNYFKNKPTQDALLAALIQPENIGSCFENRGKSKAITVVHERGLPGNKPLLYVLPGITNSQLKKIDSGKEIWINLKGVATGLLSELKINPADVNANGITAYKVQDGVYAKLINALSTDFDIKTFPYDWRLDLMETAKNLVLDIEAERAKRPDVTIHFIAHSMGGLLLRCLIHINKPLWEAITANKTTKVLMMGVPNEGSYSIVRLLLGKDAVIKKLAFVDFVHSRQALLNIFKDFPGLLQLLPKNQEDIFTKAAWDKLLAQLPDEDKPFPALLDKAKELYHNIRNTEFDNSIFRYIAGQAEKTPSGYTFKDNAVVFTASPDGDGRVLWSSIPAALKPENIYYVDADHGSIPQYEAAFEGFRDLLRTGTTNSPALLKSKPAGRGISSDTEMPDTDYVTVPDETEIQTNLLGSTEGGKKKTAKEIILVEIMNGDLVHSKHPVIVGHFKGDGIIYAEKYLDQALNFRLSEYHFANNYPGDIGSHLVILKGANSKYSDMICNGGVVVGLGEFGALTENKLQITLAQAFLTLAIRFNDIQMARPREESASADLGISSLTVGSDFAGLQVSTCLKTIFLAVQQANEKLDLMSRREDNKFSYKKISRIQVVEIYRHKSIQVAKAIRDLLTQELFSNFRFTPPVIFPGAGALSRIPDENLRDHWHRLEVTETSNAKDSDYEHVLPIRFTSITEKAHADENLTSANRKMVDRLIETLSKNSSWDKAFSQTLYELLLPNSFKGFGATLQNLVLILDKNTARYPWELLHDANGVSEKPFIINTGIVRQLKSEEQRPNIIINSSNRALVIGNPFTDKKYPDLPFAAREAKDVAAILVKNGLETIESIGEDDIEIVKKLMPRSYKIIHIAAHGIVGATAGEPSGIIFGRDMIFTPKDFDKIRIVPEFVFVNCCSSARYTTEMEEQMRKKYQLAASVGIQLIEIGVKAAIVTGWEISDPAAEAFSARFYDSMFKGKTFGEALRDARQETYTRYPQTNTWGAYQCYGDPFYTFTSGSGQNKGKDKYDFVDPQEVINALDNIGSGLNSGLKRKDTEKGIWKEKIESILKAMQRSWHQDARIIQRLATAYQALDDHKQAIFYFETLFGLEDAVYTMKAVEQYYNTLVRYTALQLDKKEITVTDARARFHQAIDELKNLKGKTQERYCLIAGCYRRIYKGTGEPDQLAEAADNYKKAYEHTEQVADYIDAYPFFNWLHLNIVLTAGNRTALPVNITELENNALKSAALANLRSPDFHKETAPSSSHLAALLLSDDESVIAASAELVAENFSTAWKKHGSENNRNSFVDYLEFFVSLLKSDTISLPCKNHKIAKLQYLISNLGS